MDYILELLNSQNLLTAENKLQKIKKATLNTYHNFPICLCKWNPVNTTVCCD